MCAYYDTILKHFFAVFCGSISYVDQEDGIKMSGMSIALLSGVLMSVQGVFNTEVTRQTSLWVSSAFVQFTALLACLAAWIFTDRSSFLAIGHVEPKYMLLPEWRER